MATPEELDQIITDLILQGAVEVSGIDLESGEPTYGFTEKLKQVSPDIAAGIEELFHMHIMALWELGFIDMNPMEADPLIRTTSFADDEKAVDSLHPDLRRTLMMIKLKLDQEQ